MHTHLQTIARTIYPDHGLPHTLLLPHLPHYGCFVSVHGWTRLVAALPFKPCVQVLLDIFTGWRDCRGIIGLPGDTEGEGGLQLGLQARAQAAQVVNLAGKWRVGGG